MKKIFYIQKHALWEQSETVKDPDISFIPSLLRRRLTGIEKIGLFLAHQLEPLPENCQIVFASRFGEWQQTIDLIRQFFQDKEMSPAGFSHSVHNAMPGILSILTKNKSSYTSIAANDQTIESGLLETFCTTMPVLFIYAEEKMPEFYRSKFPVPFSGHGCAFIVSDQKLPDAQKISMEITKKFQAPLTFQQVCQFLKADETLSSAHFVLRKIK